MSTIQRIFLLVLLLLLGVVRSQQETEPAVDGDPMSAQRKLSTSSPTGSPTAIPTEQPTSPPSHQPTNHPTAKPTPRKPCVPIVTWSALAAAIQLATTPTVFCPFVIVKPPAASPIRITSPKVLSCETVKSCVVEGTGTHLVLAGRSQLTMRGFVFKKATTSSVVVTSTRDQQFVQCYWILNNRAFTSTSDLGGGAILMQPGSSLTLNRCLLNSNTARVGGAIRHGGRRLVLSRTGFNSNRAKAGGGAIAIVGSSTLTPELRLQDSSSFKSNMDDISGQKSGAILSTTTNGIVIHPSTTGTLNHGCNGLFISLRSLCIPFIRVPYVFGKLRMRDHGILFSQGLVMEVIATSRSPVKFTSPNATRNASTISFHINPDGAAIVPLSASDGGGFAYVSNSESLTYGRGGVYALYFDDLGQPRGYKQLLGGTSKNCNGGLTPWNTWVSCEEYPGGHCYQTDPTGKRPPAKTQLGGTTGGQFEAVAVDNDDPANPVFFVTEDNTDGAVRRWRPSTGSSIGWDMLHGSGDLDFLEFLPNNMFRWTTNLTAARTSAYNNYRNVEGVVYKNRKLLFTSKVQFEFFLLDLDLMTWSKRTSNLGNTTGGGGLMDGQPDQLSLHGGGVLYVAEDGGSLPGVFIEQQSQFFAFLQMYDSKYTKEDVTGVNFSPDGKLMFVGAQRQGSLFRIRRIDGEVLEGAESVGLHRALRL